MKIFGEYLKISIISYLLVGCSSYYSISSYYGESDGIYYSTEKENYYETVFDEYAQYQNFDEQDEQNNIRGGLPWGSKPDSVEVIYNFPNFGRFYYNPFFHDMSFNPFFNNYGGFINYGFSSPFFYNSYAYGMGYPFFPRPIDFYFNPYSEFLGNYYWYFRFYRSRFGPWYNGGMYDSSYSYKGDKKNNDKVSSSRTTFSNSSSRRGARVSISNNSIKNISPRDGVSTPKQNIIQIDRTRVDIPRYSSDMNLIGVYSRNNRNYSRSSNSVPNLSAIKNDQVKRAYEQVRSTNQFERRSRSNYSYDYNNSTQRYYSNSNSNFNNSRSSSSYNSRASSVSRSSGASRSSGVSRSSGASSGGSRGGGRGPIQ